MGNQINEIYRQLCKNILNNGQKVGNTLEIDNVQFELTDITENVVGIREISKSYLFGELTWYFAGRNDVEFISKFASLWARITDDGKTSNSAYGDIIFKRYGFNQVEKVIELLRVDPSSRRAIINFNIPNEKVIETKDEICTICLQFMIRDNKLNCTAVMRSNDIWFGLPYDVVFFTELQKYIANRLNVKYGTYTHFAGSLHVYEDFVGRIELAIESEPTSHISIDIEKLIDNISTINDEVSKSNNPKHDVIEIFKRFEVYKEEKYES